jgi:lipopolysaccharide transport system ATP-binding protein
VGSLLEVGTGFHPELTGRENIFLNGAILGMRRVEIQRKFDEIVAFSEIEKFLDTPVKHYSSGMYVRLAFAVAAHLEPEILLVDEVLAVGDVLFQKKCLGKMGDVAKGGRTVLFVSHNMGAINRLCRQCIRLDAGRIAQTGPAQEVVGRYLQSGTENNATWIDEEAGMRKADAAIRSVRILSPDGRPTSVVPYQDPFGIEITYELYVRMRNVHHGYGLLDGQGNLLWNSRDGDDVPEVGLVREPGRYVSRCTVPGRLLRPGKYYLWVSSHIPWVRVIARHDNILSFEVSEVGCEFSLLRQGIMTPVFKWKTGRAETMHQVGDERSRL